MTVPTEISPSASSPATVRRRRPNPLPVPVVPPSPGPGTADAEGAALRTATPLARVLSTPLMVGLASATYNPRSDEQVGKVPDPADLCKFARVADIEQHLLGARIREAYRSVDHKHRPRWSAENPGGTSDDGSTGRSPSAGRMGSS